MFIIRLVAILFLIVVLKIIVTGWSLLLLVETLACFIGGIYVLIILLHLIHCETFRFSIFYLHLTLKLLHFWLSIILRLIFLRGFLLILIYKFYVLIFVEIFFFFSFFFFLIFIVTIVISFWTLLWALFYFQEMICFFYSSLAVHVHV